jgi:hypothetical protein
MNIPLHRTNAPGISAESVASGDPTGETCAGANPAQGKPAGWVDFMGVNIYRLVETTPTA